MYVSTGDPGVDRNDSHSSGDRHSSLVLHSVS